MAVEPELQGLHREAVRHCWEGLAALAVLALLVLVALVLQPKVWAVLLAALALALLGLAAKAILRDLRQLQGMTTGGSAPPQD